MFVCCRHELHDDVNEMITETRREATTSMDAVKQKTMADAGNFFYKNSVICEYLYTHHVAIIHILLKIKLTVKTTTNYK